jgi:NhaA family Na+:H+ antiporter
MAPPYPPSLGAGKGAGGPFALGGVPYTASTKQCAAHFGPLWGCGVCATLPPVMPWPHIRALEDPEVRAGAALFAAVVAALFVANSPLDPAYEWLLHIPVVVQVGALTLDKHFLLWVNDGLMALFFLLIGLEVKREVLGGVLGTPRRAALPLLLAVGGMAAPALIYTALNYADPVVIKGWAVPVATDIAFALGVMALLGPRAPAALKALLLSLAIIDDVGAITIIAVFYTDNLAPVGLGLAAAAFFFALALNKARVQKISPYIVLGVIMWVCVLKSGVHATLAGVLLAAVIPMRCAGPGPCPLERVEHGLAPWVTWLVLPLFAFVNAGVPLAGLGGGLLAEPLPLGIVMGLVFGNPLGIMAMAFLATRSGLARLPEGVSWWHILGMSFLCGVGFTMSLFIGTLAFGDDPALGQQVRLAVLVGSLVAGTAGFLILRSARVRAREQ